MRCFHAIRHLSASILCNLGFEVAVIQVILRHKSANTTDRYLRSLGLERVREALEDLKPKNAKVSKFKSKRQSDKDTKKEKTV
jgi:site-specific recombinase XerD